MRVATGPTGRRRSNELGSSPLHVHAGRCEEQHQSPCRCQGQQSQGCGLTGREADSETTSESGLALQVRRSDRVDRSSNAFKKIQDVKISPFVCAGSAKAQKSIGQWVVCAIPAKLQKSMGQWGRCPSKISGTRRVLDKQPSRAPGRAWGWRSRSKMCL